MSEVSPDGRVALGRSGDASIVVDLKSGTSKHVLGGGVERVVVSPDWKVLASCHVRPVRRPVGPCPGCSTPRPPGRSPRRTGPRKGPFCLASSADGAKLALGCAAGTVPFHRPGPDRASPAPWRPGLSAKSAGSRMRPTGRRCSRYRCSRLFDRCPIIDRPAHRPPRHPGWVWAVAISPNSRLLAAGYGDVSDGYLPRAYGGVKVWGRVGPAVACQH